MEQPSLEQLGSEGLAPEHHEPQTRNLYTVQESKTKMKTAKIKVQRIATDGADSRNYRITEITGVAEASLTGIVKDAPTKTFLVGDKVTHEELKRLNDRDDYDVTSKAPTE